MLSITSTTLLDGLGDPQNDRAWQRFYARYTPMLLSFARRLGLNDADAQDVVAETLLSFLATYREGRYHRERGRLKSWLGGIAQNKIRKHFAKRKHDTPDGDHADPPGKWDDYADIDDAYEREWQLERLNLAIENLRQEADPNTYQAFDLYALKEWPVRKVADFLKMSPNAVYIAKSRMIGRLKDMVQLLIAEDERCGD